MRIGFGVLLSVSMAVCLGARAGIVAEIGENVKDNWRKISERCQKVAALTDEMPSLPDSSWWFWETDKDDQREKIRAVQLRIRELLLSADAKSILKKVDRFDEEIAERRKQVGELTEERQFNPEDAEKLDRKIRKAKDALAELEAGRANAVEGVRAEFESLGLKCGGSADVLMRLVDRCDIVDNVIVAKGVCEIVDKLRAVMGAGDLTAARRYYGVYLTLVDVQALCYEQYLEKCNGEDGWRKRLETREAAVRELAETAKAGMSDSRYSEASRDQFRRNLASNNLTLQCMETYRKVLDSHESVIRRKLEKVRLVRNLAANTYGTVANLSDLIQEMKASQDDFAAVLELELPELEEFSDAAAQEQLQNITRMLDFGE